MAVTSDGTLTSAYQNLCRKYSPNLTQPLTVRSLKSGLLYRCTRYNPDEDVPCESCYYCNNQDFQRDNNV